VPAGRVPGRAPAGGLGRAADSAGTITAPMQGLILKVGVKPGDRVQIGDVVAVLEAMKMQNDIVAHRTGTVAAVHVREGDVVGPRPRSRTSSDDEARREPGATGCHCPVTSPPQGWWRNVKRAQDVASPELMTPKRAIRLAAWPSSPA